MESIKKYTDNNNYVCNVFIDLEKAFDTVDHQLLLQKLYYGIGGLAHNQLQSYLFMRQQFVYISGSSSELMPIKCRLPQGPLLFLLYINDLNCVFNKAITIHFADDTHLSEKLSKIESVMNRKLKKLTEWLRSNKLSLNSGKSVIFHSKTKQELNEITIKINKSKLSPVPNVSYLGIVLDESLSWDAHIKKLCKKLAQTNGILSKLCHHVPQKTCISVYFSFFYSFFLYGSLAWQFTSKTNLNRVFILQKKCLCIITFSFYKDHSNPLFKDLKLLKLCNILESEIMKFFYKFSRNELPKSVCSIFNVVHEVHTRNNITIC